MGVTPRNGGSYNQSNVVTVDGVDVDSFIADEVDGSDPDNSGYLSTLESDAATREAHNVIAVAGAYDGAWDATWGDYDYETARNIVTSRCRRKTTAPCVSSAGHGWAVVIHCDNGDHQSVSTGVHRHWKYAIASVYQTALADGQYRMPDCRVTALQNADD
jgi:hypothetical protein